MLVAKTKNILYSLFMNQIPKRGSYSWQWLDKLMLYAVFGISCAVPLLGGGLRRPLSTNRLRDWPRDTRTSCLHSKNVNRPTCYVCSKQSDFIIRAAPHSYVSCYTGPNIENCSVAPMYSTNSKQTNRIF